MHFAYPPRKSSNPPPFRPARGSRIPLYRRRQLKTVALAGAGILFLLWLLFGRSGGGGSHTSGGRRHSSGLSTPKTAYKGRSISGKPPVVLVTVFDDKQNTEYVQLLRENRLAYAEKHGYGTVFADVKDYDLDNAPASWAKIPAMRHAMTMYPDARYLWFLEQNALITNLDVAVDKDIMSPANLEATMLRDQPIAPPDGIIHTYANLRGEDIELAITQDNEGLATGSFILKNGDYAEFLLDTMWNELYRHYRFQRAETHALSHVVQWHQTVLARIAVLPQNTISSYSTAKNGKAYKDGDLVVLFKGCGGIGSGSCTSEAKMFKDKAESHARSSS
ncbi:alpha-1,2-galactosyltransferase-like protein [Microdochium trichocladiopsis]|uniref:Alpha-1,2-galactosyltransferase-like protein n=1 Tax=Microdochium trichocladiopsis TaxID=1682393 RepID=A0A9P8YJD0_9PEZI|nr:alpha-1,2-galactosyltransferase-like protein [Microdochium trichocladiopsis]KAH7040105.1 alpha-1,2-galactosyltransferase-like protein [Microdochium trichocladiopsis]